MSDGKKKNRIDVVIALLITVLLAVIAGVCFDYYYDLNDDVLMKDILAGVYTGTPEGHNIQMLWLVSALISLFYRICRPLPWYGLFLCVCHFGCFFLILRRSMKMSRSLLEKTAIAIAEGLVFGALFMEHLVFAQYTVTCTLLAGTAAFLFFTTEADNGRDFVKSNIPSVLLVTLAFLVRSEMLLLVLPMICIAGVLKWSLEDRIFTKENMMKYFSVFGLILLGLFIGQGTHMLAYSSPEWKTFTEFFDNRTELYDFQTPPSYAANKDFYDSIGLHESEKILLDNYNFGMDEEIDEKLVGQVAAYAGQQKSQSESFVQRTEKRLLQYVYRLTHGRGVAGSDYPWNYIILMAYVVVFLMALPGSKLFPRNQLLREDGILRRAGDALWRLVLLFGVRTVLWMYILLGDRAPERITHSLYLMELCILASMLFTAIKKLGEAGEILETREEAEKRKTQAVRRHVWYSLGCMALFSAFSLFIWQDQMRSITDRLQHRETENAPYNELYAYLGTEERADNFYLIDVYSSVSYSEKMFQQVDNSLDNYDIMGGWACKSPLQRKKLAAFGIENMEEALKDSDRVYFVRKTSENMDWLQAYYEDHGTPVEIQLTATVADIFEIYSVQAVR